MGTYKEGDTTGTRLPDGSVMNNQTGEIGSVKSEEDTAKDTADAEESSTPQSDG